MKQTYLDRRMINFTESLNVTCHQMVHLTQHKMAIREKRKNQEKKNILRNKKPCFVPLISFDVVALQQV